MALVHDAAAHVQMRRQLSVQHSKPLGCRRCPCVLKLTVESPSLESPVDSCCNDCAPRCGKWRWRWRSHVAAMGLCLEHSAVRRPPSGFKRWTGSRGRHLGVWIATDRRWTSGVHKQQPHRSMSPERCWTTLLVTLNASSLWWDVASCGMVMGGKDNLVVPENCGRRECR